MRNTKRADKILTVKITTAIILVLGLCFYWVTHNPNITKFL